jgi:hypothetical protein
MQRLTTDFLNTANTVVDGFAHYRANRRHTVRFFDNIEQTKMLFRIKDRMITTVSEA